MTTIQDRIVKQLDNNKNLFDWQKPEFKQFLIQSIKEVEEETKGDILNNLHAFVCDMATSEQSKSLAKEDCLELIRYQIERIYGKKLLSITNKEIKK